MRYPSFLYLAVLSVLMVVAHSCPAPAAAAEGAQAVLGEWQLEFEGFASFARVKFTQGPDGALTGKWEEDPLTEVSYQDGTLRFVRTLRWQDQEFSSTFTGSIQEGKLSGALSSDRGDMQLSGERVKPKPVVLGRWNMTMTFGDRQVESVLAISQSPDGSLAGQWTGRRGEQALSQVKADGAKLTFVRTSTFNDQQFTSTFEGTVAGDTLTGQFTSERGEMAASGQRLGKELIGAWEFTTTSERGTQTSRLFIDPDLTGSYRMFFGRVPIQDLTLEANQVSFVVKMGPPDQQFSLDFSGMLDGKSLEGEFTTSRGDSMKAVGKKIEPASALIGTWELTSETPRGTRTNTLTIKDDLTGTYKMRDNEFAVSDLQIDGDQVRFKVTLTFQDREVPLEFKGKLDGETLTGEMITSQGSRPVNGKKINPTP